jgi:hypothetical protein
MDRSRRGGSERVRPPPHFLDQLFEEAPQAASSVELVGGQGEALSAA